MLGVEDRDEKKWVPHVRADRQLALERSPRLAHMTGRNGFFTALAKHACDHGGELRERLNEAGTAARCAAAAVPFDDQFEVSHADGTGRYGCRYGAEGACASLGPRSGGRPTQAPKPWVVTHRNVKCRSNSRTREKQWLIAQFET